MFGEEYSDGIFMDGYEYIGKVHPVFRIADKLMQPEIMAERLKMVKRKPRVIPMPTIKGAGHVKGPLYVTEDYKEKLNNDIKIEKKKRKRNFERELYYAMAKHEHFNRKLSKLKPDSVRNCKKIAALKIKLRDLETAINDLQELSGIDLNKQNKKSKLGIMWNAIKSTFHKLKKKVKKLWRNYGDIIEGILSVAVPTLIASFIKRRVDAV